MWAFSEEKSIGDIDESMQFDPSIGRFDFGNNNRRKRADTKEYFRRKRPIMHSRKNKMANSSGLGRKRNHQLHDKHESQL